MPHIDTPTSPIPTAGTLLVSLCAALALTFCTSAPAAERADLQSRCVQTTLTFVAAVDDETTENAALALFAKLDSEDRRWLVEIAFPAYKLAGGPPVAVAVPHVFEHCMKRGAV